MRKPNKTKMGEFISKDEPQGNNSGPPITLNGTQVVELARAGVSLADSILTYASQVEKTRQIEANNRVRFAELKVDDQKNFLDFAEKIRELKTVDKNNEQKHDEAMAALAHQSKSHEKRHEEVAKIIDGVLAGTIAPSDGADLIEKYDQGQS